MIQKTIYLETYGCSANQNNSEILAGILTRSGHIITNNIKLADIIIINTCVVKSKTESKIKRKIQDLKQWAKENSNLLIIAGCMSETDKTKIKNLLQGSNILFLGTHNLKDINNLIQNKKDIIENKEEVKLNLPKIPKNKIISIHQISEGCLGNCSYCKTRIAKGKLFSYPKQEILKSIESDLNQGAKEIWITSQDNANYGLDKNKQSQLPELLNEILSLRHRFKLRLGMMDPNNVLPILDKLIECYKNEKMYKFIHLPIQSASNNILKHMRRLYTLEQAEKIINKFKKEIPNIAIATDIIVGYPTENANDHNKNIDFILNNKPDVLNISKFSSHKQTPAGKLKELSIKTIKKRTKEIMQAHRQTAKQNKEKYLNTIIPIFVNKKIQEQFYSARDNNYNIVLIKGDKGILGKSIKVKVLNTEVHHMNAEIIKD